MKLVKFKNGKYGVRRGFIYYQFLSSNGIWWSKNAAQQFELEHTKEEAIELFRLLSDIGEPVE